MLEQLCENYLRSEFVPDEIRLDYCMVKIGKTLPYVDIVGRSISGNKLYAQVTFAENNKADEKAEMLVDFTKQNGKSIMFSNGLSKKINGLDYTFEIEKVFSDFMKSKKSKYQQMIKDMIGF